jgi:phosphatidylserine/phosphatidylglycerophosphate/cardiolipin synthase-like enzyme
VSTSLLEAAFGWIGEGAGRPRYCLPFESRPLLQLQAFGDADGDGVHDSLRLDPGLKDMFVPVNGMLWAVPAAADDTGVLPSWPRLRRIDGTPFGPRQTPPVLQEHDLLLEVWPAAYRRLEYLFSSLEVPASVADWDLPQMPAPRWFWFRGLGGIAARAQEIATAQFTGTGITPDITKFTQGKAPLYVEAGDRLVTAAEELVEIRAWDGLGLAMDPDVVFTTFHQLATDSDFGGLSVQPAGSITWPAPERQVIVVSDAAGRPYVSAGDPDAQPVLVPDRELSFPGTSMDPVAIPAHGVVVIDDMPVPPTTPLIGLELPGEHQRLSLSPHGTLAKQVRASLSRRSFLRLQVTDFAAWFPKSPNPRNENAGADSLNRYTDGNEVIPLIDGKEMLREVYRALRSTHVLEGYDSLDHVPALDPGNAPVVPGPSLKARARIYLTNAWIHPHAALLGRRAQVATPRTQTEHPPEPEDLVTEFRVVPVFSTTPPNGIFGSGALADYRLWLLLPRTPVPPGTFVGLQQMAFAEAVEGDDPNLPGVELNSDIYGLIAPLGRQATTWGFAGSTGFFALRAFYHPTQPARARLQVVTWTPDPGDPDPTTVATSGKGRKRVRVSGDVDLPAPGADAAAPAIAARLEFDGTPGRAVVVIDQGVLQTAQPVVVVNSRTGEVHADTVGPNTSGPVRIPVEPFALRDWVLLGFGSLDPVLCDWYYALHVTEEQFQAGGALGHPTEVIGALQEAMLAGIDTRLLAWRGYDAQLSDQIFGATGTVATLNAGVAGHRGQSIHDETARRENSVHHQKGAFVRAAKPVAEGGGAMAFVGGVDLLSTRWDTRDHDDVEPDRQNDPMHDIHCRVRGRAVWDVYRNFRQRWNAALEHQEPGMADPGWTPVPAIDDVAVWEPGVESLDTVTMATGPCTVQVNRTLAPHTPAYSGFLEPELGDLSVEKAYRRAITEARRFIYIEDQYFWNRDLAERLHDALFQKRVEFVMILLPRDLHEKETADLILYAQRRKMLSIVLYGDSSAGPGGAHDVSDRVVVFGRVNDARTPVYVHCKSMVVDDVWASISSSNFSRRSMTYDSEIGAMTIDSRTRRGGQRLARDLRVDLMASHLGLSPEERPLVEDPYEAFRLFKDYLNGDLSGRTFNVDNFGIAQMDLLHTHYGIQPADADGTFVDGVNAIADPDGRRLDLPIGLLDLVSLFEAMDQATPGNVFGGLGALRLRFDVSAIGNPDDLVVTVSFLEQGRPEAARVALGRFPATATVNAGIIKTGLTYVVRATASSTVTPDQAIATVDVPVTTPDASTELTIVIA